jgi:hypothetical protein
VTYAGPGVLLYYCRVKNIGKLLRRFTISLLMFASISALAQERSDPTAKQCRHSYGIMVKISKHNLDFMRKSMTAGDELVLSTKLQRCLSIYPNSWSPTQTSEINGVIYELDADVISRMFNYLDRQHLAGNFNDEEEKRKGH